MWQRPSIFQKTSREIPDGKGYVDRYVDTFQKQVWKHGMKTPWTIECEQARAAQWQSFSIPVQKSVSIPP